MIEERENEIEVTWDLLKKERDNPSSLSEDEKTALLEHTQVCKKRDRELRQANDQLEEDCKYLTSGSEKRLIPAYGWIHPIKEMAYELEALNISLKKFHTIITFDQTKEKFGTFRGYYSIYSTDRLLYKILMWPLNFLRYLLETKINYQQSYVETTPRHDVERYVELDSKEIEECKDAQNVVEISGKKYKKEIYSCAPKSEIMPSRFKFIWKIKNIVRTIGIKYSSIVSFANRESREDIVVRQAIDNKVQKIVDECERKCDDHCIRCGRWIGKDSRRFQTRGWVTYVCPECAKLDKDAIDCTASTATRVQLAFETRLKKAIEECELDEALVKQSSESLKEAISKLGSMKLLKSGDRKLEVGEYDDEDIYVEEDDEFGC